MDLFLIALMIFGLRLVDVSLGTLRIVFLTRGEAWRAGLIGFLESLVWVFAVTLVLKHLDDPVRMIAFAAGFGAGTFVGMTIERHPAKSITTRPARRLASAVAWISTPAISLPSPVGTA